MNSVSSSNLFELYSFWHILLKQVEKLTKFLSLSFFFTDRATTWDASASKNCQAGDFRRDNSLLGEESLNAQDQESFSELFSVSCLKDKEQFESLGRDSPLDQEEAAAWIVIKQIFCSVILQVKLLWLVTRDSWLVTCSRDLSQHSQGETMESGVTSEWWVGDVVCNVNWRKEVMNSSLRIMNSPSHS